MPHRYEHMSSWKEKLPFYASTEADRRDLRKPEDIGRELQVMRFKSPKKKMSKLHDQLMDVMSRL